MGLLEKDRHFSTNGRVKARKIPESKSLSKSESKITKLCDYSDRKNHAVDKLNNKISTKFADSEPISRKIVHKKSQSPVNKSDSSSESDSQSDNDSSSDNNEEVQMADGLNQILDAFTKRYTAEELKKMSPNKVRRLGLKLLAKKNTKKEPP